MYGDALKQSGGLLKLLRGRQAGNGNSPSLVMRRLPAHDVIQKMGVDGGRDAQDKKVPTPPPVPSRLSPPPGIPHPLSSFSFRWMK